MWRKRLPAMAVCFSEEESLFGTIYWLEVEEVAGDRGRNRSRSRSRRNVDDISARLDVHGIDDRPHEDGTDHSLDDLRRTALLHTADDSGLEVDYNFEGAADVGCFSHNPAFLALVGGLVATILPYLFAMTEEA